MHREYRQFSFSNNFGQNKQEQSSTPETKISCTNLAIKIIVNKIFSKITFSYPSRKKHEVYTYIHTLTYVLVSVGWQSLRQGADIIGVTI